MSSLTCVVRHHPEINLFELLTAREEKQVQLTKVFPNSGTHSIIKIRLI